MDHDDYMASDYRSCITRNIPLPEELIEWFDEKCGFAFTIDDWAARISVTRRYRLQYSPQKWHEVLAREVTSHA